MTNAYWRDFWGSSWRRSNPYGSPGKVYDKGYHRGEDIANNRLTSPVPVLRTGTIIDSGRSDKIGFWTAVKPDSDPTKRDIYCHMYEGNTKRSGRVNAGDIIGRTAGWGEKPGTGWDGPHLHFVISNNSHGGFNVAYPDYDPRPVITAALNAASGSGASDSSQPFPKPEAEEDDMPDFVRYVDSRKRNLAKGTWQNLYLNDKNHTSFVSGKSIVQTTAVVQVQGLPVGGEVQFRLVRTKAGTNDIRGGTGAREAAATGGTTFATVSDSFQLGLPDDGLRWQYAVQYDDVTVVQTEVTAVIHRA